MSSRASRPSGGGVNAPQTLTHRSYPVARSALRGKLQASLSSAPGGIHAGAPAARELRHLLAACRHFILAPPPLHHPSPPMGEYVLFFDGRSRGNSGPRGAGAVVIRVDTLRDVHPRMERCDEPRVPPHHEQPSRISRLGDRAGSGRPAPMVTPIGRRRQPAHHQPTPPVPPAKNNVLRCFYHSARRLADGLGVTRSSHHLRAFNKAANIAMDTHRSIQTHQPTARPEWAGLDQLSTGDFLHWQASILGDH